MIGAGIECPIPYAGGKMYCTDQVDNTIERTNIDGTSVADLITTGFNSPLGLALHIRQ